MLLKIAWKNIWRNRTRSLVVITAVALGLWAGVFATSFVKGMMKKKIETVIKLEMSDFQIHPKGFRDKPAIGNVIENEKEIREALNEDENVVAFSSRLVMEGSLGTPRGNGFLKAIAVDPKDEALTTGLNDLLIEGQYFPKKRYNTILISKETAEKYKLSLRSKPILRLLDGNGDNIEIGFRVVGIYQSDNSVFDGMHAFVMKDDVHDKLEIGRGVHQIAVALKDHDQAEILADQYQQMFEELEVKPWIQLATGMRFMVEAMDVYLFYIVGIILLALLFSILNTMLMAVLERVREIGMLMAVGMSKPKVFTMIMLETIMLSMIGAPLGLLLSYFLIQHFGSVGIDLTGAGYADAGFASIIYPYLDGQSYLQVTIMVLIMSVLAAIYPAIKALKLIPVDAIRKI